MLEGAKKDKGHVSPNWEFKYDLIEGVRLKDVLQIEYGGITVVNLEELRRRVE